MLTAELDMRSVDRTIDRALARGRNLAPVFRDVRTVMKVDQQEHARERSGPAGKWPPRAASTLAKLRAGGRRARRPMGKLLSAVKYTSSGIGAIGTSLVKWSGGAISTGGKVGHGATLPARVWLYASDQLQRFAAELILDYVVGEWGHE